MAGKCGTWLTSSSLDSRKTKHPDLFKWFCIDTIKVCCPKGTFGSDCNGMTRPESLLSLQSMADTCAVIVSPVGTHPFIQQPVWEVLRDHAMATGPVTEMEPGLVTASAAVTTDMRESFAWTVLLGSSMWNATTLIPSAQVNTFSQATNGCEPALAWLMGPFSVPKCVTIPVRRALASPIGSAATVRLAGRRTRRAPVMVRRPWNVIRSFLEVPSSWRAKSFQLMTSGSLLWYRCG